MYDIVKDVKFERMKQQKTEDQHDKFKPRKAEDQKKRFKQRKGRSRRNKSREIIYPHPNRYYEQMILSNVGK